MLSKYWAIKPSIIGIWDMRLTGKHMCSWNKLLFYIWVCSKKSGFISNIWLFEALLIRAMIITNQILRFTLFSDKPAHIGSMDMFPWISWISNFSIFGGYFHLGNIQQIVPVVFPSATTLQVLRLSWYRSSLLPWWPESSSIQGLLKQKQKARKPNIIGIKVIGIRWEYICV